MQLLCVGDIAILDEYVTREMWEIPEAVLGDNEARILFNWEFPIGTAINPRPRSSGPRFLAHPSSPYVLKKWVPGFAGLGNNHILDGGEDGLVQTMETLKQIGFTIIGAGQTWEEITQPVFWETAEGRLAIVNWVFPETHPDCMFLPGPNCWPGFEEAERTIQELKQRADWVLIRVHWSDEFFAYPLPEDRAVARELAKMGADLVIGDHPHVVRGTEIFDGCPVFYSIGNFFFSNEPTDYDSWNMRAPRNHEALGVLISFHRGKRPECQPLSFWKLKKRVEKDPLRRAAIKLERFSQPLRQFQDSEYAKWYTRKRAAFNRWGYLWHFRVWNLSLNDVKRILLKHFRVSSQKS